MADDEIERLRAALAHAHEYPSFTRRLIQRMIAPVLLLLGSCLLLLEWQNLAQLVKGLMLEFL